VPFLDSCLRDSCLVASEAFVICFEALYDDVVIPTRSTAGSAGLDVCAHLDSPDGLLDRWIVSYNADGSTTQYTSGPVWLRPGARVAIPLGFKASLPEEWECQVRPRSGLALKHGLTVLNAPGTIDADYQGEWAVILHNTGHDLLSIRHGDRIAQLVLAPVYQLPWVPGKVVPRTERTGGFGSTGT
jgi:dUTP pyrophosphatase